MAMPMRHNLEHAAERARLMGVHWVPEMELDAVVDRAEASLETLVNMDYETELDQWHSCNVADVAPDAQNDEGAPSWTEFLDDFQSDEPESVLSKKLIADGLSWNEIREVVLMSLINENMISDLSTMPGLG